MDPAHHESLEAVLAEKNRELQAGIADRDLLMQDPLHRVAIGLQRLPRDTREQLPELLHELHRALSEQVRRPAIG